MDLITNAFHRITIKDLKFRDGQALSAVSYRVVQGPLFEDRDSHGGKLQYIMNTTDEVIPIIPLAVSPPL